MILIIQSDESYLYCGQDHSRVGIIHCLGFEPNIQNMDSIIEKLNRNIYDIHNIMDSSVEAELSALFINCSIRFLHKTIV